MEGSIRQFYNVPQSLSPLDVCLVNTDELVVYEFLDLLVMDEGFVLGRTKLLEVEGKRLAL